MYRIFSSWCMKPTCRRPAWRSRILLGVLLLFIGVSARAAEPDEKPDAKRSQAKLRAYLPTIRKKALFDNELDHGKALARCLGMYKVFLDAGTANQVDKGQVEAAFLRSGIHVWQRDTEYRDSVDDFTSRVRVPEERRQQMENAALSPLTKVFRGFEDLSRDFQEYQYKLFQLNRPDDVKKTRPALIELLTTSALVKNTALPKRITKAWGEWEKIDDLKKLRQQLNQYQADVNTLRERRSDLLDKGQKFPEADRQRLESLQFAWALGNLHHSLCVYESQPWAVIQDEVRRSIRQDREFRRIGLPCLHIIDQAYGERLDRLRRSWPVMASTKLKDVDLLACAQDEAERRVASGQKTVEAQLASKKKVRRLRNLGDSYQKVLPRLFELSFLRREQIYQGWNRPAPRPTGLEKEGGPIGGIEPPRKDPFAAETVLGALDSFAAAKRQLLETWIDYQMVRLDLYADLGLSPP